MRLEGCGAVVTGAASGIGEALARHLAAAGAHSVVLADIDGDAAARAAGAIAAARPACRVVAETLDVRDETALEALVARTEDDIGPIDLFCSNAGVLTIGGVELPTSEWQRLWEVNVLAHVHAARAVIPRMAARGGGNLLQTASAAGLLSQIGSGPYSATKHAAVGLAEYLAITHGHQGIRVTVLCPQAVATAMTAGIDGGGVAGVDGMLGPDDVAAAALEGLREDRFLVLPHPEVATYLARKAADPERWILGMQRLQHRYLGTPAPEAAP